MAINDPRDIPGLVCWASAEYEAANYTDGQSATGWTDLSGNGNHATAQGDLPPQWFATGGPGNGPRMRFRGTHGTTSATWGYFSLPNLMSGATAGHVFFSIKSDGADCSSTWFGSHASASSASHYPFSGTIYEAFGTNSRKTLGSPVLSITTWRRYSVWSAASDFGAKIDGTSQFTSGSNTVGWTATPTIGHGGRSGALSGNTGSFQGDMGGFTLYNRKLTSTEEADLDAWWVAHPNGGTTEAPADPTYPEAVRALSPWGYWRMGESSGNLADSSGLGRTLTLSGTAPTYGAAGAIVGDSDTAITFGGSGHFESASSDPDAVRTMVVWVKATAYGLQRTIVGSYLTANGVHYFRLMLDGAGKVSGLAGGVSVLSPSAITDDAWHMIALVLDGGTVRVYVDAVEVVSSTGASAVTTANAVYVGGRGNRFLNGALDEAAMFTASLTDTQIADLYEIGTSTGLPQVDALLSGSGALTAETTAVAEADALLGGSGALTATSYEVLSTTGSMIGSGGLTADSAGVHAATGVMSGTGEFTASISTDTLAEVTADLIGSGAFAATSYPVFSVDADLTGSGAVTATSYAAHSVTGTMTGTGTFGVAQVVDQLTVEGDVSTGYGSQIDGIAITMAPAYLGVLDPVLDQPPGAITVVMTGLTPLATVTFRIDNVIVDVGIADVQGDIDATSILVDRQFGAGAHTVSGTTTNHTAEAPFTITANAISLPVVPAPDAPPTAVPGTVGSNGVHKWVLQDPGGLGSWVMPINPTAMSNPHVRKSVGAVATTAVHGRPHVSEGARPVEWEFSGFCPNEAFQDQLIAYAELPRRFYLIDHRNRAWTVAIASLDIRPRKRVMENGVPQDWLADYTARVVLFSQTPEVPSP